MPAPEEDEVDILELVRILWQQKSLIIGTAAVTAISAIALTLVVPKVFEAEATVLPTASNDAGAMLSGLAAQLGPAAGMLSGVGGGGKTADLIEILNSRSMAERVIIRTRLAEKISGWKYQSQLISTLRKMVKVTGPTLKSKLVVVHVEASDPKLSADLANAYVDELKAMLDEIGYDSATKNLRFIKEQLDRTKVELAKAEEALAAFQMNNQLEALPETVVSSMESVSSLEAQRISATVQLKATEETLKELKNKVGTLQADPSAITELELKRNSLATQTTELEKAKEGFVSRLSKLPPKGMELARLKRDVEVQNAVYLALRQQYEARAVTESKESDAFVPLDRAVIPDVASGPRKSVNGLWGLIAGLFVGIALGFVRHYRMRREVHK